jgi:hypothetical protein
MKQSIVYRVENSEGHGPYTGALENNIFNLTGEPMIHDDGAHPTPQEDGLDFHYGTDFCAFHSFADCLTWFGRGLLDLLEANGFNVYKFAVEPAAVRVGKHQVVINGNMLDRDTRVVYE